MTLNETVKELQLGSKVMQIKKEGGLILRKKLLSILLLITFQSICRKRSVLLSLHFL